MAYQVMQKQSHVAVVLASFSLQGCLINLLSQDLVISLPQNTQLRLCDSSLLLLFRPLDLPLASAAGPCS